jgi:hypothetical protein
MTELQGLQLIPQPDILAERHGGERACYVTDPLVLM